jgi:hypothetical protein
LSRSWLASRALDHLLGPSVDYIDHKRVGISGHSRNGKQAMLAGAFDERVAAAGKRYGGSGGALDPPGPLPVHLRSAYIEYSECLPTLFNPLAERTYFSQVTAVVSSSSGSPGMCPYRTTSANTFAEGPSDAPPQW